MTRFLSRWKCASAAVVAAVMLLQSSSAFAASRDHTVSRTPHVSRRTLVQQTRGERESRAIVTSARMMLNAGNPLSSGNQGATVTVALFSDYDCAACGLFWQSIYKPFKADYVDTNKVHFVFRNYPVNTMKNPHSQLAAEAVECVRDAGDANAMNLQDTLFDAAANEDVITTAKILGWAKDVGVDIRPCVSDHRKAATVQRDINLGNLFGIPQLPAVVITNRDGSIAYRLIDIYQYDWFRQHLNEALRMTASPR